MEHCFLDKQKINSNSKATQYTGSIQAAKRQKNKKIKNRGTKNPHYPSLESQTLQKTYEH